MNYFSFFLPPIIERREDCPFWYSERYCPNCGGSHGSHFITYGEAIAAHNTVYIRRMIREYLKNIMKMKGSNYGRFSKLSVRGNY